MPSLIRFSSYLFIRQDQSLNPAAGYFIPISPPEGELDFPILKDQRRSEALPTSPTSVASLVAGVLFVLAIGSKRDSDSKLGFLFWNESVLKKDLPILKRGWFTVMNGGIGRGKHIGILKIDPILSIQNNRPQPARPQ